MRIKMIGANGNNKIFSVLRNIKPVIWIIIAQIIFFGITTDSFFQWKNFQNIFVQSSALLIIAFGQTVVVLTQSTDLSLGAQISVVTVVWVQLMSHGWSALAAAVFCVMLTMLAGVINGVAVGVFKIPSFIATIGMQFILSSLAVLASGGASVYYPMDIYRKVAKSTILFIPTSLWVALVLLGVTWFMLHRTKMGANVYALGGNPEALSVAGVNTTLATIKVFVYAGFLAGIAGLLTACRLESGQTDAGSGYEFNAVAATLLGGTKMREGNGDVTGTIFGVWMIQIMKNGLNLIGLKSIYQQVILGTVVVTAIVVDALISKRRNKIKLG